MARVWDLNAVDGNIIDIRGDARGICIGVVGRDHIIHQIILTPAEAEKVLNALALTIDRASIDIDQLACKGLADLGKEASL